MCIIVYKPKGVELPSIRTLQNCYDNNSDGCGFMYENKGKVEIKKGYRDFDTFYKDVSKLGKQKTVVMHFRISTQGGVKDGLTHPYPLCTDYNEMRKLRNTCDVGIAHNGIIQLTSNYSHTVDYNDTMTFIKEYASLIITSPKFYNDGNKIELLKKLANSKLAIMSNDGNVTLIGDFIKDGECYYSNTTYKDYYYYYDGYSSNKKNRSKYKYSYDWDWVDNYYNNGLFDFNDKTGECPCEQYGYSSAYYCGNCANYDKCKSKYKNDFTVSKNTH